MKESLQVLASVEAILVDGMADRPQLAGPIPFAKCLGRHTEKRGRSPYSQIILEILNHGPAGRVQGRARLGKFYPLGREGTSADSIDMESEALAPDLGLMDKPHQDLVG